MGVLSRSMLGMVCAGSDMVVVVVVVVVMMVDSRLVCWNLLFGCSLHC
jgi:hypothetical protein